METQLISISTPAIVVGQNKYEYIVLNRDNCFFITFNIVTLYD